MTIRPFSNLILLMLTLAFLPGCRSAEEPGKGSVEVRGAWARATAPGQETGGVFLTIRNSGDVEDRLTGGSTPASEAVEIHSMTMDGNVMRMRRQPHLTIPARSDLRLAPGGTHLMLLGLRSPLVVGSRFPLNLEFAKSGEKQVEVRVMPIGSGGLQEGGDE